MNKGVKIYIAGPYTQGHQRENVSRAVTTADLLLNYGFVPFIPHLNHFWDLMSPKKYEEWMDYDTHWLLACDAVLRLSGSSAGGDREVALAQKNNIPVFYQLQEVLDYFDKE